jgi:K+-transporting ATPase ATPase C chain
LKKESIMKTLIRPAITLFLMLSLITGIAYPVVVYGVAKVLFPHAAEGSLIVKNGKPVGSSLIGQNFTSPQYFWGRPSATSPYPDNGTASSGSNLGPLNPALTDAVKARITALRQADPTNTNPVPIDLVTASASGLDPDISPAAAQYQVPRVASARKLPVAQVQKLVDQNTSPRQLWILGEARVNVLNLNLALDAIH